MPKTKRTPKKKLLTPEQLVQLDRDLVSGKVKGDELDVATVTMSMEALAKKHGGFQKAMRALPSSVLADTLRGMADYAERQATTRLAKRGAKFPVTVLREAAMRLEFSSPLT